MIDFLPTLPALLLFTTSSIVLAITPGPDMTLFLSKALSQGRNAGLITMFGAVCGILVHTLFAAFGISALIQASPTGFLILKICGAIYLLWLAIQTLRQDSAFKIKETKQKPQSPFSNWFAGFTINILNPKIAIFFITFLPQFISPEDPNASGKMIFLGCYFILIGSVICTLIILMADKVADTLKNNKKVAKAIDWMFASVLSAFAIQILLTRRI